MPNRGWRQQRLPEALARAEDSLRLEQQRPKLPELNQLALLCAHARCVWLKLDLERLEAAWEHLRELEALSTPPQLQTYRTVIEVELYLRIAFEQDAMPDARLVDRGDKLIEEAQRVTSDLREFSLVLALLAWAHDKRKDLDRCSALLDLLAGSAEIDAVGLKLPNLRLWLERQALP